MLCYMVNKKKRYITREKCQSIWNVLTWYKNKVPHIFFIRNINKNDKLVLVDKPKGMNMIKLHRKIIENGIMFEAIITLFKVYGNWFICLTKYKLLRNITMESFCEVIDAVIEKKCVICTLLWYL